MRLATMRWHKRVGIVVLIGAMGLAAWDRVCGQSPEALQGRAEAAFLVRAALEGCREPERWTLPESAYVSPDWISRSVEAELERKYGARMFESLRMERAGAVEMISFRSGGPGCDDNVFIPLRVEIEPPIGPTSTIPIVVRVTPKHVLSVPIPFVSPEITGFYFDDEVAPRHGPGQ